MMSKQKTYVPDIIRVRLSSSFMIRTKCKHCQTGPTDYYIERAGIPWKEHNSVRNTFNIIKRFWNRLASDYYLGEQPSSFNNLSMFNHTPSYKGFRPRAHRNRGVHAKLECIERVCCACGLTNWAFYEKGATNRPEISQRKARYRYPQKFVY